MDNEPANVAKDMASKIFLQLFAGDHLVHGAKLKCDFGSNPNYLMIPESGATINGLPKANITHSKKDENIFSFGLCDNAAICEEVMKLDGDWVNTKTQKQTVNEEEVITKDSYLFCIHNYGFIRPMDTGQSGEYGELMEWLEAMDEEFPGLMAILSDPNASVYLCEDEGMYQKALDFLSYMIKDRKGSIEMAILDENNPKDACILAALGHLTVICMDDINTRNEGLKTLLAINGKDPDDYDQAFYLNDKLMKEIQIAGDKRAEALQQEGLWGDILRWNERNKGFLNGVRQSVTSAAYYVYGTYKVNQYMEGLKQSCSNRNSDFNNKAANENSAGNKKEADVPDGYYQDKSGRWHRPNGQVASYEEVRLAAPKTTSSNSTHGNYVEKNGVCCTRWLLSG